MNIEDGHDLPLRVTFQEEGGTPYWRHHLAALPHVGDTIILGSAPKGESGMSCEGSITMSAAPATGIVIIVAQAT